MANERYRVGLIGCGRIGFLFDTEDTAGVPQTHASGFASLPQAQLVAGANRGRERLEAFGKRFGVSGLYQDYREMLRRERLDIVCIATHPGSHADMVTAAAEAGVRGIFCEKPLSLHLGDADIIIGTCEKKNIKLIVNHSRRWSPLFRKACEIVEKGEIGELIHISGHCLGAKPDPAWQSDEEGPLLHDATHLFDMFRFFAGDVEWVCATARRTRQPFRVEDDSMCIFQFKNGASGVSIVDEQALYTQFDVEIGGTEGRILLDDTAGKLWKAKRISVEASVDWHDLVPVDFPAVEAVSSIQEAAKELIGCIEGDGPCVTSGYDGRAALEIIMAIYESERRGNARVELPLGIDESVLHILRREGKL